MLKLLSSKMLKTLLVLRYDATVIGTSITLCQKLYLFKCTLLFVNLRVVNVLYFSNFLNDFSLCFNVLGLGFNTLSMLFLKKTFPLVRKESGFGLARWLGYNPSFSSPFSFWKCSEHLIDESFISSISSISMYISVSKFLKGTWNGSWNDTGLWRLEGFI